MIRYPTWILLHQATTRNATRAWRSRPTTEGNRLFNASPLGVSCPADLKLLADQQGEHDLKYIASAIVVSAFPEFILWDDAT